MQASPHAGTDTTLSPSAIPMHLTPNSAACRPCPPLVASPTQIKPPATLRPLPAPGLSTALTVPADSALPQSQYKPQSEATAGAHGSPRQQRFAASPREEAAATHIQRLHRGNSARAAHFQEQLDQVQKAERNIVLLNYAAMPSARATSFAGALICLSLIFL
eukprot:SAG31_NODE_5833_length_2303_cov_2.727314_2_plen_162_part_00